MTARSVKVSTMGIGGMISFEVKDVGVSGCVAVSDLEILDGHLDIIADHIETGLRSFGVTPEHETSKIIWSALRARRSWLEHELR